MDVLLVIVGIFLLLTSGACESPETKRTLKGIGAIWFLFAFIQGI